jgi:hypothetical protein
LARPRTGGQWRVDVPPPDEGAGIKLGDVASDVLGASGRQMLEALVRGVTDASLVGELAKGSLRGKRPQLERALTGQFGAHQMRFLLAQQLAIWMGSMP